MQLSLHLTCVCVCVCVCVYVMQLIKCLFLLSDTLLVNMTCVSRKPVVCASVRI